MRGAGPAAHVRGSSRQENVMTTAQRPIGSGFGAASTTSHVLRGVDLVGKVAIVTGGYSGLGLESARALASAGARVIVPTRDRARAEKALGGAGGIELVDLDLLAPDAIDDFAARFVDAGLPLDILMNNAAVMALAERTLDARGHELQLATNHLGHFHLTARLWPALARTPGARVVVVSSMGHHFSPVVFDDLHYRDRPYDPWTAYGQSKTANILFALELDRRAQAHGVRAFSLHPGGIPDTDLPRHMPAGALRAAGLVDERGRPRIDPARDVKSIPQGAATQVWCAVSPQLANLGGVFCADCDVAPVTPAGSSFSIDRAHAATRVASVHPHAIDPDAARRLWDVSELLTKVRFLD
ncbi:Short-chain dehydrogenase/reductase SDR [Minicystis rosea]|nr:Short-chain dehydrogenase/reductase SDR [Minicystis rosea]